MQGVKIEYRVAEGAALIECHPNTLRRLEKIGVIKARRNYLGYRIFRLEDLLRLKANRDRLVETLTNEGLPEMEAVVAKGLPATVR